MIHLALWLLVGASMQPETVSRGGLNWTPTEATVEDMSPLSTSQRLMPLDMRVGSNFDRLYKLNTRTRLFGGDADSDYYMRMNGGITAVFPRSAYSLRKGGVLAEIPAGTVFSIGGNLSQLVSAQATQPAGQPPARPGSNFIDRSARPVPPGQPQTEPARPDPARPADNAAPRNGDGTTTVSESSRGDERPVDSLWYNEEYRQQRIAALLDQALAKK
jgi:hypothetical protein